MSKDDFYYYLDKAVWYLEMFILFLTGGSALAYLWLKAII